MLPVTSSWHFCITCTILLSIVQCLQLSWPLIPFFFHYLRLYGMLVSPVPSYCQLYSVLITCTILVPIFTSLWHVIITCTIYVSIVLCLNHCTILLPLMPSMNQLNNLCATSTMYNFFTFVSTVLCLCFFSHLCETSTIFVVSLYHLYYLCFSCTVCLPKFIILVPLVPSLCHLCITYTIFVAIVLCLGKMYCFCIISAVFVPSLYYL